MPFKDGWIQTIKGIKILWLQLQQLGFKFLRTRALNQDSIENLFCNIRQYGSGNTRPTCFQFISALKTATLNNLIHKHSAGANCEIDENSILDNLETFMDKEIESTFVEHPPLQNELLQIQTNYIDSSLDTELDIQAMTYVCGYLFKKTNKFNCSTCFFILSSDVVLAQHIFVSFKEYDDTKRLSYASESFVNYFKQISDIAHYILKNYGYINNLKLKLIEYIKTYY